MADKSAHKERTKARILDEAAQALRARGTEGVSVAALMKRAGLTHGGFYAHFSSRDDLVAHAVGRMFQDSARMLDHFLAEPDADGLKGLIDHYLSEQALDAPERNCPLPALSGEVPRMPPAARQRFEIGTDAFRMAIVRALRAMGRDDAEPLGASVLAELVGAMALARSNSDRATALKLLASSRDSLKARLDLA
jgi:TetR/AcrR family transcriptional repressor of nem operon